VEHVEKKARGQQGTLTICCKNFDLVKLKFSNIEEALNVASSIEVLSTVGKRLNLSACSLDITGLHLSWFIKLAKLKAKFRAFNSDENEIEAFKIAAMMICSIIYCLTVVAFVIYRALSKVTFSK